MVSETLIDGLLCADWFLKGSKWEMFFATFFIELEFSFLSPKLCGVSFLFPPLVQSLVFQSFP